MKKILFVGDSVTDCGRSYDNDANIGCGYPMLVKSSLGMEFPAQYEFVNKGINGNRIADVYARIYRDIINLKPDIISILIGVNDVWGPLTENPDGANAEKYYKIYDMLVEEIKEALPDVKIMIMEPFVLKGECTQDKWDEFRTGVDERIKKAKKIAKKYNLLYVPLQEGFNELCKKAQPSYWLVDGVHPTSMGNEYLKNEWIKAFKKL